MNRFFALCVVTMFGATGAASASVSELRELKQVNDGLIVIAAGDMIQKYCPTISPRMFKAYSFARQLQRLAREAGFNDDQIEEFVEDKAEKTRVKSAAQAYLLTKGLDPDVPESYCTVGRYEIDRNSQIGVLLKAK